MKDRYSLDKNGIARANANMKRIEMTQSYIHELKDFEIEEIIVYLNDQLQNISNESVRWWTANMDADYGDEKPIEYWKKSHGYCGVEKNLKWYQGQFKSRKSTPSPNDLQLNEEDTNLLEKRKHRVLFLDAIGVFGLLEELGATTDASKSKVLAHLLNEPWKPTLKTELEKLRTNLDGSGRVYKSDPAMAAVNSLLTKLQLDKKTP